MGEPCQIPFGHGSALIADRASAGGTDWGCSMSAVNCAKCSCVAIGVNPRPDRVPAARVRSIFRLLAVVLAAASLGACAQSSAVRHSAFVSPFASPGRQASQHDRTASFNTHRHVASARKHTPFARPGNAAATEIASRGVASFYTEGQQTASGESFNTNDLTAAHPTLPFGTRLRVTNVATGRSVTVRVNDRGPYVPGRVVDVSKSAANALGMVQSGTANVKLDVVQ